MLTAIFAVLVMILAVLFVMLPKEKQTELYKGFMVAVLFSLGILAFSYASPIAYYAFHITPIWVWMLVAIVVLLYVLWIVWKSDETLNQKIRAGDAVAIEQRIESLMKLHKYTRERAETAVNDLRSRP